MEETEEQAALLESIELGMLENVTKLLDGGLDPNFVLNGRNPVCVASEVGYDEVLTVLLAHGGNPNHQDSGGLGQRQPMHLACCAGHVNCVRVLLQAGVDVNIRDGEQRTPLHWAATYGCVTVVEFLIESGCTVNTSQTDGFTPLHAATCLGYDKPCRVLVENGADVNAADDDGWAAIHSAACYGHRDLISYFLQNGADIDQRTEKQETPLHIAASCGHVGIVQALLRLGADIDCKNSFGYTPFHVAVLQNKYETAEVLASVNAEVNTASRTGCSPFFLAAIRAQENFMRLILGMGFDVRSEKWLINDNHYPNALKARPDLCEWLSIFCTNPRTLKQNCVLCVRKLIGKHTLTKVHFLEIPEMLKDYITLPFV